MTTRTSKRTVTFRRPFVLSSFDEELPAGLYEVETDEDLLQGISFPAYRRVRTLLHLHPDPRQPHFSQTLTIDPNELDTALERDRAAGAMAAEADIGVQAQLGEQRQVKTTSAATPSPAREPRLDELMRDPIVRSIMHSDGVSHAALWSVMKAAQSVLAVRSTQEALKDTTKLRLTATDRRAVQRAEDGGLTVRPR